MQKETSAPLLRHTQSLIHIPFKDLSLQEDCHYLLWPTVGILLATVHELYSGEARKPTSSFSTDLPGDMEFCFGRLSRVLIGVPVLLR